MDNINNAPYENKTRLNLWLMESERDSLRNAIADALENELANPSAPSLSGFQKEEVVTVLQGVLNEIGVAVSRYENGKIPSEQYRAALGKTSDMVPLWVSPYEILVIISFVSTPRLADKLIAYI